MSEGYVKSMEMLRNFSGKTKDIELTDDSGKVHSIKMYPLPNKYIAELLELQKFSNSLPKTKVEQNGKMVEVIDQENISSEDRARLYEMNRKVVALSFAHSLKKLNGSMTDAEFNDVKDMVDELPATVIQQIIFEVSGINDVPLGQEEVKEGEEKKV